jgi:pilus assembly protein CpaC
MLLTLLIAISFIDPAIAKSPERVILETGDSQIIRLNSVTRIAVGDEKIADVRIISKNEVLLVGKAEGGTSLYIWSGQQLNNYQKLYIK